jgi:hypothetical protein
VQAAETVAAISAARTQQRQAVATQAGQRRIGEAETAAQQAQRGGEDAVLALQTDAERAAEQSAAALAASQRAIDDLAGGPTLTASRLSLEEGKAALRAETVPMQQALLAAADASGALNVAPVVGQLMQMADAPGVGTTNSRVLAEVASALDAMAARRGGVPSAEDIYAFRKDDLDDIITRALSAGRGGEVTSQAARRGATMRTTQRMIDERLDEAIRAAGGGSWQHYLDTYSTGMRALERQEMVGIAGWMLRQNPRQFANLVRGESPDAVEAVFGRNRIDLADVLEPAQLDALQSAARVLDESAAAEAALGTQTTAA